jgi:hypothetical protein
MNGCKPTRRARNLCHKHVFGRGFDKNQKNIKKVLLLHQPPCYNLFCQQMILLFLNGSVAQSVEQRTENPRVGGSIPSRTTIRGSGSGVEHRLAKARVAGSNPVFRSNFICWGGGIGRRTGLKILRWVTTVSVRVRPSAPNACPRMHTD